MDKNHIKIDDLVRSRLSGAEEREPAGAWQNMRALLDQEMPAQTAAAFDWRRMLGYATVLILASSVTVGGYNYYRHALAPSAPIAHKAPAAFSASGLSANGKTTAHSGVPAATVAANSNPVHSTTPLNTHASGPVRVGNSTASVIAPGALPVDNSVGKTSTVKTNPIAEPTSISQNTESSRSLLAKSVNQFDQPENSLTASVNKENNTLPVVDPNVVTRVDNKRNDAQETPKNTVVASTTTIPASQPADDHHNIGKPVLSSAVTASKQDAKLPVLNNGTARTANVRKDTIRQIEIAYHAAPRGSSGTPAYRRDTISITKIIVERPKAPATADNQNIVATTQQHTVPAPVKPNVSAHHEAVSAPAAMVVPQSAAAAAASENIQLVSLSKFKVADKLTKLWNAERFHFMVQQVKADLSKAQFYAGMTGGINATFFGASSLAGFQAGLTGLLAFNERWSIAGELKFYQRFNTGGSINDNYVKVIDPVAGNYTVVNGQPFREWTWRQDTVSHSYNFTSIQTLELPVLVRYNFGRILTEAGINMMYAFAVNTEEIDRPNGNPTLVSRQLPVDATKEGLSGSKQSINHGDFGSRFGIGYAIGAGYQFTPALQLNMRMVQSVWDNATSTGAAKVSRNFYQTPSIQLSIGYRFRQGKGR